MNREEFNKNCEARWKILYEKSKRYKASWRNYSLDLILELASHRLSEVRGAMRDTGNIDLDNLIDSMNFMDFALSKVLDR